MYKAIYFKKSACKTVNSIIYLLIKVNACNCRG